MSDRQNELAQGLGALAEAFLEFTEGFVTADVAQEKQLAYIRNKATWARDCAERAERATRDQST